LIVAALAVAPPLFAQDRADEIAALRQIVTMHERRIAALEQSLRALLADQTKGGMPKPTTLRPPSETGMPPWKFADAWQRIKEGMSRSQVEAILGRPTSEKTIGPFHTLFYQGHVPGQVSVTGTVELRDDRVWQVNIPVFY
jgi:hypothetical protein